MAHSKGRNSLRLFLLSLFLFIVALGIGMYANTEKYIDEAGITHESVLASVSAYIALASAICFGLCLLSLIFGRRGGGSRGSSWN